MKKKLFITTLAVVLGLGITSLKAKTIRLLGDCSASGCPGSGSNCCMDAQNNLFYKANR